ncbi:MAG: TrbG/VirB9 family P-type conjugative transfer protein [Pseudomonadota bacterium]
MIFPLVAAGVVALAMAMSPAEAQTPFTGKGQVPTTPPPKAASAQPAQPAQQSAPSAVPPARVPMSAEVQKQAIYQSEGVFPEMDRSGAGGQIQEAWNLSEAREGVYATRLCEDCVYKVRTREFMTTTLVLPEDAVIVAPVELGDPVGFKAKVIAANKIVVRPSAYGMDTNLNVTTKSGAVYPFYIRSESFNSVHVPDLVVKILGREKPGIIEVPAPAVPGQAKEETAPTPDDKTAAAIHDLVNPKPAAGDFVRNVPFDPAKLHGWGDYKLWGDEELKPETVYRDDFFTYVRYGKKWDGMELSTGYVTIDGIDELVNTRVQGTTFIIESVSPLITLKNGKKYLCIQYTGEAP